MKISGTISLFVFLGCCAPVTTTKVVEEHQIVASRELTQSFVVNEISWANNEVTAISQRDYGLTLSYSPNAPTKPTFELLAAIRTTESTNRYQVGPLELSSSKTDSTISYSGFGLGETVSVVGYQVQAFAGYSLPTTISANGSGRYDFKIRATRVLEQ